MQNLGVSCNESFTDFMPKRESQRADHFQRRDEDCPKRLCQQGNLGVDLASLFLLSGIPSGWRWPANLEKQTKDIYPHKNPFPTTLATRVSYSQKCFFKTVFIFYHISPIDLGSLRILTLYPPPSISPSFPSSLSLSFSSSTRNWTQALLHFRQVPLNYTPLSLLCTFNVVIGKIEKSQFYLSFLVWLYFLHPLKENNIFLPWNYNIKSRILFLISF